jgi:Uma2 family endonuclease
VNLRDGQVEVYREPAGPEYLFRRIYRPGESLSPRELPEGSVSADDLLGR